MAVVSPGSRPAPDGKTEYGMTSWLMTVGTALLIGVEAASVVEGGILAVAWGTDGGLLRVGAVAAAVVGGAVAVWVGRQVHRAERRLTSG